MKSGLIYLRLSFSASNEVKMEASYTLRGRKPSRLVHVVGLYMFANVMDFEEHCSSTYIIHGCLRKA